MKKVFVGIALLGALIVVIGALGSGEQAASGDTVASPAASAPAAQAAEPVNAAPAEPSGYAVGEQFKLGDFSYKVKGHRVRARIGKNQFLRQKASPGAKFVVVTFEETNEGDETHVGLGSNLTLRDSQGREFRPSSRGEMALASSSMGIPELQPGLMRSAATAFEVPEAVANQEGLIVVVNERGTFAGGTAQVRL
jgi:hypothetical protein